MTKEQELSVFLHRLNCFGISEKDFRRANELITKRWGYESTVEDTYWVILNHLAGKHSGEPYIASRVYFQIRDHLVLGGNRKPKLHQLSRYST